MVWVLWAPLVFREVRCLWCSSLRWKTRKLGCLTWGMNPLLLREKFRVCKFPSNCESPSREWGLARSISASTTFLLVCPIWRSSLASSQVFFKGNCPIYICRFAVSMGGSEFMIFLCLLLRPHPLDIFYNISETHRSSTETTTEIKACNILSLFSLSQGNVVPRANQK